MAAVLRARGLQPGERVGVLLPNVPEYLVALFGTWMAGGVTVPLNPLMVAEEVAGLLQATSCRFVVCLDLLLPLLRTNGGAGAERGVRDQPQGPAPAVGPNALQGRPTPPARDSIPERAGGGDRAGRGSRGSFAR